MTLGLAEAAFEARRSVDVRLALDASCAATSVYKANFPRALVQTGLIEKYFNGEIGSALTEIERPVVEAVGAVDVLLGGPPCQGHSNLNNYTRRDDPRNALYLKMARAAEVLNPQLVVIENVPAVIHDRCGVVDATKAHLTALGYDMQEALIPLERIGLPQLRRRHILVASRPTARATAIVDALREQVDSHVDERLRTVEWAIGDLLGTAEPAGPGFDSPSRPAPVNEQRIRWLLDNDEHVLPNSRRPRCHQDGEHSYKSIYGRMRWDRPAHTITTGFGSMGQGCYVHAKEPRTITPHEAARLQTFPDFFRFDAISARGAWATLIGNAVPPLLMLTVGRTWLAGLDQNAASLLPYTRGTPR